MKEKRLWYSAAKTTVEHETQSNLITIFKLYVNRVRLKKRGTLG